MKECVGAERNVPPGLVLPGPDFPVEQYLSDTFNHPNHNYDQIAEYGAFVVALAVLDADVSGRISVMPTKRDLQQMFEAGYGVSPNAYLRTAYGGIAKLQQSLGFYPRGIVPDKDELLERFDWMHNTAYPLDPATYDSKSETLNLLRWGAVRDLSPNPAIVYKLFDGDTTELSRAAGIERQNYPPQYDELDLLRFGARVIRENGGPLVTAALDKKYDGTFPGGTYDTIRNVFGSISKFWLEFGYVIRADGFDRQLLLSLGARWAIQNDGAELTPSTIASLSAEQSFPSRRAIDGKFKSQALFRQEVQAEYEEFERLEEQLATSGVSPYVLRTIAGQMYQAGPTYRKWLTTPAHLDALRALSVSGPETDFVLTLIQHGPILEDEQLFDIEIRDLKSTMSKLNLSTASRRFIYKCIPRLPYSAAIAVKPKS